MEARAEYQLLYSEISPGLLEAVVKHANMENRLVLIATPFKTYTDYTWTKILG